MPWLVTTSPWLPHALGLLVALARVVAQPVAVIGAATASLGISGLVVALERRVRRRDAAS